MRSVFLPIAHGLPKSGALNQFPPSDWPDRIPLLYFSYHIMVGLGTIFIAIMVLAAWQLWRGRLYSSRAARFGFCCCRCRFPTSPTQPAGSRPK